MTASDVIVKKWFALIKEKARGALAEGLANLEKVGNQVDVILSHCAPSSIQDIFSGGFYKKDELTDYLDQIRERCTFKRWFFGHYHIIKKQGKGQLFRRINKEKHFGESACQSSKKRREGKPWKRQNNVLFAGLVSVCSASAFPLNSQICGQIFRRSRASAFRTNSRALQKKNPQIFVLPARKSEDFWSECL